ncbi:hypothetical protein GHT07_06910 [Caenimonas koreensis DSM 17982]|uniref:Outer membrane lipoprotein BamD-like domain-containing protein n=1 Tax=Caenimonas koreensis DSM 17982 TaxID=1121255 RepID=A0A844B8Z9_9BURK|nr:outer membrane protein assembly factor BamD [Caenimonas koreensis]MRD47001.1 hypothetical protein [Caenimonas koreensis DSM 17982]
MKPVTTHLFRLAVIAASLVTASAHAQLVDDVELRRVGNDAVLQVRFVTPVQYLRTLATGSGDLGHVYYDVLPTPETINFLPTERRIPAGSAAPFVVMTDETVGTAERSRRLVLRLTGNTPFTARAGQGNRSIEIVLRDRGAMVPATSGAAGAPVRDDKAGVLPAPSGTAAVGSSEAEARAQALLAQARQAVERADYAVAVDLLEQLLAQPATASSQDAQELIAVARWREGDPQRARVEFETYLKLYPTGPGALRAREALLTLAPPAPVAAAEAAAAPAVTTTVTGSVATYYYGGQSKSRTQEFQDSALGGLPTLVSDASLSGTDQSQILSSVDLNWRRKDADSDLRFVLRDTYSADLLRNDKSKNKLSAFYVDYRLQSPGLSVRLGRQSPTGGGVMGRFDGVQASWRFAPKWRLNAVAGQPTDKLLDSRRSFYGASIDADALTSNLGGSLYVIEQRIDGQTDRRAIGNEMRLQMGGLSASSILDYDTILGGLNIASVQGTWQSADNTVVNVLYDRRATPMLMLGNSLFFQNPVLAAQATRLQDLLAVQSVSLLRQQVKDTTAYSTQAMVGVTHPLSPNWQIGADIRLTNIGELLPVPDILPSGQPGTGNIWSVGAQVIATNLYSSRDTHVLVFNQLKAPTYKGTLLQYNNSSTIAQAWQLEPSLRIYQQTDSTDTRTRRWAPGMRVTYRPTAKLSLESELSLEFSNIAGPTRTETSRRTFYYFGFRYDI